MDQQIDILLTRAVDGRASREDWIALEAFAAREPSVWRELALAQRDQALLTEAVERELAAAGRVDLPSVMASVRAGAQADENSDARSVHVRGGRLAIWGGWAAAAAVALLYVNRVPTASQQPMDGANSSVNQASLIPGLFDRELSKKSADEVRDMYVTRANAEGRLVSEVPAQILLEATPLPDGRLQVRYIRQFMETATVPVLYRFSQDELGQPQPVRVRVQQLPQSLRTGEQAGVKQPPLEPDERWRGL
jgi:hypothetical protein